MMLFKDLTAWISPACGTRTPILINTWKQHGGIIVSPFGNTTAATRTLDESPSLTNVDAHNVTLSVNDETLHQIQYFISSNDDDYLHRCKDLEIEEVLIMQHIASAVPYGDGEQHRNHKNDTVHMEDDIMWIDDQWILDSVDEGKLMNLARYILNRSESGRTTSKMGEVVCDESVTSSEVRDGEQQHNNGRGGGDRDHMVEHREGTAYDDDNDDDEESELCDYETEVARTRKRKITYAPKRGNETIFQEQPPINQIDGKESSNKKRRLEKNREVAEAAPVMELELEIQKFEVMSRGKNVAQLVDRMKGMDNVEIVNKRYRRKKILVNQ